MIFLCKILLCIITILSYRLLLIASDFISLLFSMNVYGIACTMTLTSARNFFHFRRFLHSINFAPYICGGMFDYSLICIAFTLPLCKYLPEHLLLHEVV